MTARNFGSPHQGNDERYARDQERSLSPSQRLSGNSLRGLRLHRGGNVFHVSPLSSRPALDGGNDNALGGSRGVTQYYADNVIQLPSRSILAPVPPLELPNVLQAPIDVGVALFWIAYCFLFVGASVWALVRLLMFLF